MTHFEGRTANSSTLHRWAAVPRLELSCIWEGSSSASGTDEVYHSYGVCRRGLHILKIGGQGFRRKPVVASVSLGPPTQTQNKRWICLWGTEHSIVSSLGVRLHISIPSTCWLANISGSRRLVSGKGLSETCPENYRNKNNILW